MKTSGKECINQTNMGDRRKNEMSPGSLSEAKWHTEPCSTGIPACILICALHCPWQGRSSGVVCNVEGLITFWCQDRIICPLKNHFAFEENGHFSSHAAVFSPSRTKRNPEFGGFQTHAPLCEQQQIFCLGRDHVFAWCPWNLTQCPVLVRLRQEACSQESNSGEWTLAPCTPPTSTQIRLK